MVLKVKERVHQCPIGPLVARLMVCGCEDYERKVATQTAAHCLALVVTVHQQQETRPDSVIPYDCEITMMQEKFVVGLQGRSLVVLREGLAVERGQDEAVLDQIALDSCFQEADRPSPSAS